MDVVTARVASAPAVDDNDSPPSKPACIFPMVELHGPVAWAAAFNGRRGQVVDWVVELGMYQVKLDDGRFVQMRLENVLSAMDVVTARVDR